MEDRNPGRKTRRGTRFAPAITLLLLAAVIGGAVLLRERGHRRPTAPRGPVVSPRGAPRPDPFTSIPPDTLPIAWRDWSQATFAAARAGNLPVVALLDAGWSESCALYAGWLAANPAARAALENGVVAVRVDADRRPDVHARFCLENSALPAWILLTPDGATWGIDDALAPEALARRIADLRAAPRLGRPDPGIEMLRRLLPVHPSAPPDLAVIPERVFAALADQWPAAGTPPAADSPLFDSDALVFLHAYAARTRSPTTRALDRDLVGRLAAAVDSTGSVLQEVFPVPGRVMQGRFLATHAMLLDRIQDGGDARCAAAARRVAAWMETTLLEPHSGLFRAAQGTLVVDKGRPVLTATERARMLTNGHTRFPAPLVVAVCPTAGNARAAAALLRYPGDDAAAARYRALGRTTLAALQAAVGADGRVPHDFAVEASGALRASDVDFLVDYAELGLALLRGAAMESDTALEPAAAEPRLATARRVGDALLTRFAPTPPGAFFDVPPPDAGAPERLRLRLSPLADNGRACLFLLELGRATGDPRYTTAARAALAAWSSSAPGQSPWDAASYALAVLVATH